jgi:hypothetical protein
VRRGDRVDSSDVPVRVRTCGLGCQAQRRMDDNDMTPTIVLVACTLPTRVLLCAVLTGGHSPNFAAQPGQNRSWSPKNVGKRLTS